MIIATRHGDRELRFGPNTAIAPAPWSGYLSASGVAVTTGTATGLPAVGRAVRLIAGLVGSLDLRVYRGTKGDRQEQPDSWPARLLRMPVLEHSDYDWRYDIAAALEVYENAFLLKRKSSDGRLAELLPIPPMAVTATVERGEKRYEVWTQDGRVVLGPDMILHIRGQTVDGGPFGVSRIHQHRDPVGAMLAAQRFEGAYFRNHARPDVALIFPANVTQRQASEWRDVWNAEYGGPDNAGKALPLGGGATIEAIPLNMRDAQFVETRALGVEDVGRIMDVEPLLLGAGTAEQQDTQAMDRFLALQLPPRLARIARALWADPDLFAPNSDLYPAFDVDALSFTNPSARANVQHMQIQSGILLPDEARADNGRPPLPDGLGQIPQITPVGGAPNPDPATGSTDTQE